MWPAVPTTTDFIVFVYSRLPSSAFAHLSLVATGTLFALLFTVRRGLAAPRPSLALAHALENLYQAEIHLAHLHVDADHLHLDLVAKTIDLVRVLASEQVRTLHEPVIVVRHRRHVHEPFDEVLDQLDEQTECGHAGDVAFELIADFVGHELHFLPQHEKRNRLFFGLAVDPLDEFLEMTRAEGACRRGEAVAEAGDELLELRHLQNVRLFVNAIERRRVL